MNPVRLTILEQLSETNIVCGLLNHVFIPGSISSFFRLGKPDGNVERSTLYLIVIRYFSTLENSIQESQGSGLALSPFSPKWKLQREIESFLK